jgi:hypothetical protein
VVDQDALAEQVARIAVGQFSHVSPILLGEAATAIKVRQAAKKEAIGLLTLKPSEDPWHRDGWVFQAISWIAAHDGGGVAIRAPHLIKGASPRPWRGPGGWRQGAGERWWSYGT